ncbi:conserved hypothetical protein [Pediculus humanus corporis]|uniref:CASC1 C-terminal domain-containing protein n=1 Tax=Pediculus humanus subsp. corporis TaxID=121224 RepID=E0W1V5_PEDHC|nr:uncharacterized protein Phum_PHUM579980 [Pediculus humanus corporis]EEB19549.1 conserved hypothetical protein [Pediculus humanus corporis]
MGLVGLACYRYCNFPFQTWEMKPESKNQNGGVGVLLNITAAVAIIEFLIKDGKVSVNQLQNGTTNAMQEHVGIFYRPKKLINILQNGGVDIFPPPDVFCYLEGTVLKHRAAENHLYHCMSVMSTSHNFAWSRWNAPAGRRNMILQMREVTDKKRPPNYNMLHVTPLKAILVDCTEVSASFNDEGIQGMKFYSDLYNLAMDHCSQHAKEKIENVSYDLSETICEMLCAIRPLSFS